MSFLPRDYQAPSSGGGYMKLMDGENKIRILSQAVTGWEDWTADKKPVRYRDKPMDSFDPKKPAKHFWCFIVWNYSEEQIQILNVTQSSIRKSLMSLCQDHDWGDPYFYDLKIVRTGEGMDTEYMVNPLPHKPLQERIRVEFFGKPINLEVWLDGGDPFAKSVNVTPLAIDLKKEKIEEEDIPF